MSSNPAITIGVSAIDTSKQVLAGVDQNVRNTTANIEAQGAKIQSKFSQISANIKANITNIATAVAGLGAGIVSFATSFDTLEKAQYRSDKANLTLAKSQEVLNEMLASGKASAEEIANQQELVALNTEKARLAQDDLGDTYTNFFANVPAQMISFGVAANSIYTMIRGHQAATAVSSGAMAGAYTGALGSMNVANNLTAASIRMLRGALNFLAAHPIILAFMGLATLITLVATNTFGLRDAFFALGKALYDFFNQYFKPLADAMAWFYDNVLKPIGDFMAGPSVQSAEAYSESLGELEVQTNNTTASTHEMYDELLKQLEATKDIDIATVSAGASLGGYVRQLDTYTDSVNDATRATNNLVTAQQMLDSPGVRYESSNDYRITGERAELKEKYGNIDLIKVGKHWRPKDQFIAGRNLQNAQEHLQFLKFKAVRDPSIGIRRYADELSDLEKAQVAVDEARAAKAQADINLQVIVNERAGGGYDVEAVVDGKRRARLRAGSQVLVH